MYLESYRMKILDIAHPYYPSVISKPSCTSVDLMECHMFDYNSGHCVYTYWQRRLEVCILKIFYVSP